MRWSLQDQEPRSDFSWQVWRNWTRGPWGSIPKNLISAQLFSLALRIWHMSHCSHLFVGCLLLLWWCRWHGFKATTVCEIIKNYCLWVVSNANSYFLVYVTSQKITASIYISWIVYVCIKQNKTKTMSHTEFSNVLFWLTKASHTKVRTMLPHTCIRFRALNIWIQCK